ncbi:MAG TPA: carboxypeptidase regulatory-like domain-containing protein [Acidimicrobiales bacterium]|nr:carboxypeptidase regulatory-like domain-containing protein [Acidimicrobiales bacterium]
MRARLLSDRLAVQPGQPAVAVVEVTNTLGVIDGVTATAHPGPGLHVGCAPSLLALFPDASGQLTLTLTVDRHFPAGDHLVTVEVSSSVEHAERVQLSLAVSVQPVEAATLTVDPPARRAHRAARYRVTCANDGNTTLDVQLAAADPARALTARLAPPSLLVPPGGEGVTELRVVGRRHLLGTERRQQLTVVGQAGSLEMGATVDFRQRPLVPVGARTSLILGLIVVLWAAVFLVALQKATSSDPLTKQVPPSFYASVASAGHPVSASAFGVLGREGLLASASDGPVPAGAVPKSGVVIGVGGTIAGVVRAASTQAGIGRITVQAVRDSPNGTVLVSSAATAADGTYSLIGLLPGSYKLHFSATGFQDLWYPDAASAAAASPVTVDAQATTAGIDATVSGQPGSISGTVDTGQTPAPTVTVTAIPEQGSTGRAIATVQTDAAGNYAIPNLASPGSYDLTFTAPGYQVGSETEEISGGEAHIANTITLSAGPGTLGGVVTDGTNPLGGVTITANADGQTVTSATPTTGTVGQFSIPNLTTPATYLLTFTKAGYGTDTVAEHLGPGQSLTNLDVVLAGGAGQISGTVTDTTGSPLGGVAVSVANSPTPATTNTLTAGSVGSYVLTGLTTPGNYAVTFSRPGYQSQTVAVPLGSAGSAAGVDVKLAPETGAVTGTVTSSAGQALSGVTVSATDGTTTTGTTSTSSPAGGFSLGGLAPSSYSITFSLAGYQTETVLVQLQAGQTARIPVSLTPAPTGP